MDLERGRETMTVMGRMTDAVQTTIESLDAEQRDTVWAGACALAVRFAEELDGVRAAAARADRVAEAALVEYGQDSATYEEIAALRAKLAERTALDRIGARLLYTLEALCAVPKGRKVANPSPAASSGALGQLRAVSGGSA
jgi:hypothetical protein